MKWNFEKCYIKVNFLILIHTFDKFGCFHFQKLFTIEEELILIP